MIRDVVVPFAAGLLFAAGLGLSEMTRPDVVIAFLDPAVLDPRLAFVMLGAIAVHLGPTWWVLSRGRPIWDHQLHLPTATRVDSRLVIGAAVFGLGWGLAGYCPGPAVVAASAGSGQAAVLVVGMLIGMGAVPLVERVAARSRAGDTGPSPISASATPSQPATEAPCATCTR